MSAILKALRKVEDESVQQSEVRSVPKKLDAKKAIRDQYKKSWTSQKFLIYLLPLLTLTIVLWVVFTYRPFLISRTTTVAVESNASSANIKPSPSPKGLTSQEKKNGTEASSPAASSVEEERGAQRGAPRREKKEIPASAPTQQDGPSVEDPEFNLQAIVWSELSESRFAVINGVIVRAGGMIEGVSVTEIAEDHVSFKSGQRTWKMKMMAR